MERLANLRYWEEVIGLSILGVAFVVMIVCLCIAIHGGKKGR